MTGGGRAARLLVVTHYMPPHEGGIERIAEEQTAAAAAAGFAVTWAASRVPPDAPADERVPSGRRVRVPAWNGLEERLGVPYPVWLPASRAAVRRLLRDADLVHVHDALYPGTSAALGEARRLGRPSLLTQHVGFVPYPSTLLETAERAAYATIGRRNARRATAAASYSEGARLWLERVRRGLTPPAYLPNGVDTELFRPARDAEELRALRERHRLPPDLPVVLFVGRLVPKKGAHLVVAAAESLAPTLRFHLLLVGERGTVALPSIPAAGAEPVASVPRAELRPFVPREALAELLRAADVVALPSTGEGFPLVAQEAMASGAAVVLGDDPGYARQLDPGAAVLVPPTAAAVGEALARLIADPAARAEIGRRARQSALGHWGRAACRARLVAAYRAIAAGGRL